jgi:hypothetical protein
MRRILAVALAGTVVALAAIVSAPASLPKCPTEDSVGPCVWNAAASGNGLGESFRVNADQSVTYLP